MNTRRILSNLTWFLTGLFLIFLFAFAMGMESANATGTPQQSTPSQDQAQTQTARADQSQTQTQSQSTAVTATNGGNDQATSITTNHVKQAPAIGQGTVFVAGCGVGGNAGASGSGGAGFLGVSFTPDECYRLLLAQAFAALAMTDAACEVLISTKTAKRAFRDKPMPSCAREPVITSVTTESAKPVADAPPTREQVNDAIDRAFKQSQAK